MTMLAAAHWEQLLSERLGWPRARASDHGVDLVRPDRQHVIEMKYSLQGARDLHAAVMQLGLYLKHTPEVVRGTLVVRVQRMSSARVLSEWKHATTILKPEVTRRLALIAIATDGVVIWPDDTETRQISAHVREIEASSSETRSERTGPRWSPKSFEVWKILFRAWLRHEASLSLQEIQQRSATSYPTVSDVLDRLEQIGELQRASNRSATLTGPPRRSLEQIVALGDTVRETHRFVDRSGRPPHARDLIRRIRAKAPEVALGGVEGARHYMPDFDLNGYPRVDVTMPEGVELAWVKTVDPALAAAPPSDSSSVRLVVHRLRRTETAFVRTREGTFADPVEIVLDLHELRLADQASEFVTTVRGGGDR